MSKTKPKKWAMHQGADYVVVLRPTDETTETGIRVDNVRDARFIVNACNKLAKSRR